MGENVLPSSMQHLTTLMQDYFDAKSRASSPSLDKARRSWYSVPPDHHRYSDDVVRIFLNIFQRHIPNTFTIFKQTSPTLDGQTAYTLAMAATGALFCSVLGSAEVAMSMYSDSRRLLLASVRTYSRRVLKLIYFSSTPGPFSTRSQQH